MQELIHKLMQEAGLTEAQAIRAIQVIREVAKEKFPIFSAPIDQLFDRYSPKAADDFLE